jgi:hypothetical protein
MRRLAQKEATFPAASRNYQYNQGARRPQQQAAHYGRKQHQF